MCVSYTCMRYFELIEWACSLTGLLSFMLSDEMTTGSVTTTTADKKAYARLSHAWNCQQKRFKEAFPEVRPQILLSSFVFPRFPDNVRRTDNHMAPLLLLRDCTDLFSVLTTPSCS